MPSFPGRRPSPAMIIACLALAVSLGGTGVAAVTLVIPRNSVGTAQLKNNAVTAAKVARGTLRRGNFAPGVLTLTPGPQGAQGPPGPAGPQGQKGDTGPAGASGAIGNVTVHSASVTVPASPPAGDGTYQTRSVQANCDSNEKGLSGGTNWSGEGDTTELVTTLSTPIYDSSSMKVTGWRARGGNDTASSHDFQVYVVCSKS